MKQFGMLVVFLGMAGFALAGNLTPEIDGNSAVSAVAIVSGGVLILRARKKR